MARARADEQARARAAEERAAREAALRRQREAELAQVRAQVEQERSRRVAEERTRLAAQTARDAEVANRLLDDAQRFQAQANYDAAVASYRQNVLTAFQDVEDNLSTLRVLADEAAEQADAVASAERSLALAKPLSGFSSRYRIRTHHSPKE